MWASEHAHKARSGIWRGSTATAVATGPHKLPKLWVTRPDSEERSMDFLNCCTAPLFESRGEQDVVGQPLKVPSACPATQHLSLAPPCPPSLSPAGRLAPAPFPASHCLPLPMMPSASPLLSDWPSLCVLPCPNPRAPGRLCNSSAHAAAPGTAKASENCEGMDKARRLRVRSRCGGVLHRHPRGGAAGCHAKRDARVRYHPCLAAGNIMHGQVQWYRD